MSDEIRPEEPTYQSFISAAMEFLVARPNANVLILVESSKGMETFRSVMSPIWNLGALHAAQMQFANILAQMTQQAVVQKEQIEAEEQERIQQSGKRDKEKAN